VPGASTVAAISLRTEFFAPLIFTKPESASPGLITYSVACGEDDSDIAASITRVTTQRRTVVVDADALSRLQRPHDTAIVAERAAGPDRFELEEGPFSSYVRTLEVQPQGAESLASESRGEASDVEVVEVIDWKLGVPIFWVVFWLPVWLYIRGGMKTVAPWWAPAGRLDARSARVIGLLGVLAIVNGFLGTVIGQTLTFAADEFCSEFETTADGLRTCIDPSADRSARGDVFSIVRIAVVLSVALTVFADRAGRRAAIRLAIVASCVATAVGALATGLPTLTMSQIVARGLATGLVILIGVFAAEELPPRSRAYGVSMLILLAGLGSGMVVWLLPVADLADRGWRLIYAMALVFLPAAWWAASRLPTSLRFASLGSVSTGDALRELRDNPLFRSRLLLLATTAMLGSLFAQPASQFDNDFLRSELGFDGARITLFTIVTSTPVGIGVLAGGIMADRIGRRPIGALGVSIGVTMTVWSFFAGEPEIWAIRTVGTILGSGLAVAALAVYGPELFPTRLRSTANGAITAFAVLGTVFGLQLVGRLAERWDAFGPAIAVVAVGPAIVILLILTRYPETASRTLEDINDEPELDTTTLG
jgi:MFS family permease